MVKGQFTRNKLSIGSIVIQAMKTQIVLGPVLNLY